MDKLKQTTAEESTVGQTLKVQCVTCHVLTNHCVMAAVDTGDSDHDVDGNLNSWRTKYQVIKCLGCDVFSFRHWNWDSEAGDFESNGATEKIYPERDAGSITIKRFRGVPQNLREIYWETITSFNSDCLLLCAVGLRAIVEGVCVNKGIKDGNVIQTDTEGKSVTKRNGSLQGKIAGLHEKGVLTASHAATLHAFRDLGNDAVHQLGSPSTDHLRQAIEVIEHLLEHVYVIPKKSVELKKKVTKHN